MGKPARSTVRERLDRELEGLEPQVSKGSKAIPRGKRQIYNVEPATGHPGSTKGRLRFYPALRDALTGQTRVDWRRFRKAKSRGPARPGGLGRLEREQGYLRQTGRATLTPAQRRRSDHKFRHSLVRPR